MKGLESLNSIFKDRIFKIPDYQRGYSWTEDQLKDFWEDILSLQNDKQHYTGVITIKEINKNIWKNWNNEKWLLEERGYKSFYVVDGQQRLITFVIFIQSLYDLLKNLPANKNKKDEEIYIGSFNLKQIKEDYIVIQKPPQSIINSYKFSYEISNPSSDYLKYKIFNEQSGGQILETFYTLNLNNAKKFFQTNLEYVYDKKGLKGIESIFKKLTQNLIFNLYTIDDSFDVYVAFETMNNRGKKLSNLELLKNRLIYLTTLYEDKKLKEDDKKELRKKINTAWKEVYYQLGRNKNFILSDDEFLRAHWIMYFPYKRQKGDEYVKYLLKEKFIPLSILKEVKSNINSLETFEEIKEEQTDDEEEKHNYDDLTKQTSKNNLTPKQIEKYVLSLKSSAKFWYNTWNPINNNDLTEDEIITIDRLNRVGMSYFRPLVTASFLSEKTTSKDRKELFEEIERFIFISFKLSKSNSNYGSSEFYKCARQLINNEITTKEIINKLKKNLEWTFIDGKDKYLNETYFKSTLDALFKKRNGYYSWSAIKYFLYEYEMDKAAKRGNKKIDWKLFIKHKKDKPSIEHIFPQNPKLNEWPTFKKTSKKKLKLLQGSLGNLVPLSQSINSSLQNNNFKNKKQTKINEKGNTIREGYDNGSYSEIEISKYDDWTPKTIKERGLKLLDFMEKRWNFKFRNNEVKESLLFLEKIKN